MKIELGGGTRARGEGFLNVDIVESADIRHDLNVTPWPIDDESVDELYSSHCIEHVDCPHRFLRECARICRVGAKVEIRAPDPMSEMAMCAGHKHVVSINFMRHADHIFPESTWAGSKRKLHLDDTQPIPDDHWFRLARENPLFAMWKDSDIMAWLPRTRHENRFYFTVVER